MGRASDPRRIGQAGSCGLRTDHLQAGAATARPPSQTWRTFLTNHVATLGSVDFFTVPTVTGRILFVFVVLLHHRRRIVHFNVTEHPTAAWTAQQIVEAFPDDTVPRWLLRDRDAIYGDDFRHRVAGMGIDEVISGPSSPWQNPYAERLIGSIRRECLDHVVVLGERHLRRILTGYVRIITVREHISRWRKTRQRLDACRASPRVTWSPSRKSAVCTTVTNDAPPDMTSSAARCTSPAADVRSNARRFRTPPVPAAAAIGTTNP